MERNITTLETLQVDNIDSFNWDSEVSEIDFFGETVVKPEKEKEENTETNKGEKKLKEKSEKVEEESTIEDEESLFKDFIPGNENSEDEESAEEDVDDKGKKVDKVDDKKVENTTENPVLNFFKKQSSLELTEEEIQELEELDEDDRQAALEDYFERALEERLDASVKELPDALKNIIKYVSKGGDLNTFLKTLYKGQESGLDENLDLTEEENQESIVRQSLQEEEYDEDYIDSQIEFLKDSGKLEVAANKYFNKWKSSREKAQREELARVEAAKKAQREAQITFKKDLSNHISTTEDFKGFKLSKREIEEMPEYISSQTVKMNDGRVITPFYRDLFEAMKDKDKLVLLAKLVKTDFDFTPLAKNIDTKRTKALKEDLQRQKDKQTIRSTSRSSQQPKRLIDLIE